MIWILFCAFLTFGKLELPTKEVRRKTQFISVKESQKLKVLHSKIFILRSKWIPATAAKNEDLIPLSQNFHVNLCPKTVSDHDSAT